jgi:hypothetical protein
MVVASTACCEVAWSDGAIADNVGLLHDGANAAVGADNRRMQRAGNREYRFMLEEFGGYDSKRVRMRESAK